MSDRSALCSLHASLVKDMKYIRLRDRYPDLIHYPPPPVPGTEIIVPITSAEELVREGHEQENCVTSYFPDIAIVQTHYVYRVFQPERCTLSLQKTDDEWHPSQLAGKQNREASKETWQVVNDWFAAATGSQQDIDPHSDPDS